MACLLAGALITPALADPPEQKGQRPSAEMGERRGGAAEGRKTDKDSGRAKAAEAGRTGTIPLDPARGQAGRGASPKRATSAPQSLSLDPARGQAGRTGTIPLDPAPGKQTFDRIQSPGLPGTNDRQVHPDGERQADKAEPRNAASGSRRDPRERPEKQEREPRRRDK
jgi:hypothetical protein